MIDSEISHEVVIVFKIVANAVWQVEIHFLPIVDWAPILSLKNISALVS